MKYIQYPNGSTGAVSDKVADILAKRPGHKIITPAPEPKPEPKKADK
jgi:hypothetical protein